MYGIVDLVNPRNDSIHILVPWVRLERQRQHTTSLPLTCMLDQPRSDQLLRIIVIEE